MTVFILGTRCGNGSQFYCFAQYVLDSFIDQMIKDRRKEQSQASKRGPKKTATSDRAVGSGRAKREAAMKARRGMTETKKPDKMAVEREVYRQSRRTATAKEKKEQKATGGRLPPNSTARRDQKKKEETFQPTKKMVAAAVAAMKKEGYKVPRGHRVVITVSPTPNNQGGKKASNDKKGGNAGNKGKKTGGNIKQNTKPKSGGGRRKN